VLGTRNLLNVLRTQLEAEGVGVATTRTDPPKPVIYRAGAGAPCLRHRYSPDEAASGARRQKAVRSKLTDLDCVFEQEELNKVYRVKLKLEFVTTETLIGIPRNPHWVRVMIFESHEMQTTGLRTVIGNFNCLNRQAELRRRAARGGETPEHCRCRNLYSVSSLV
jgi:hypothetical protein